MQDKVIRMTEEIWNLPAGAGFFHRGGHYCAIGKLTLACGVDMPDSLLAPQASDEAGLLIFEKVSPAVWRTNDEGSKPYSNKVCIADKTNHELAIRMGIEELLAKGYTLETDDTVSKELARIKNSVAAEVV